MINIILVEKNYNRAFGSQLYLDYPEIAENLQYIGRFRS